MTPDARLQAAIELIERIALPRPDKARTPADAVVAGYMRGRRYIGSKDRRVIAETVFGALRRQPTLDWLLAGHARTPRTWAAAWLSWIRELPAADIEALFSGSEYGPAPLSAEEWTALSAADERINRLDEAPAWARGAYPEWLDDDLIAAFGKNRVDEMAAFAEPAPVDLRVNPLKATREEVLAVLEAHDIAAEATPLSPWGIRLSSRANLQSLGAYRHGWFEPQDEAAQIASLLAGAEPGMVVLDYCAGAGGKTLALAGAMAGQGTLVAHDLSHVRLKPIEARAERAGVDRMIRRFAADNDAALSPDAFDRVVLDVPCSGTGTWRRQPEGRLRLTRAGLEGHVAEQRDILDSGAAYVAPGGRLVYMTCSILPRENAEQISAFLERHPEFTLADIERLWAEHIGGEPAAENGAMLLTPKRHGTDGFFCVVMERRAS